MDIFVQSDAKKLLKNKSIVFIGDSNIRAQYKDLLCLLLTSKIIDLSKLKTKMEATIFGDKLVYHSLKTNARTYREERAGTVDDIKLQFFFVTRVYDSYMEDVLRKITEHSKPDIVIVNSCVWDITRWGPNGVKDYKENLKILMKRFKELLPDKLIIWVTAPPVSCEIRGGFLVEELQFLKFSVRFHVVEANHYARKVVAAAGFDVLDSHYHLLLQLLKREMDGIHWSPEAVRYVLNLTLTHISLAYNSPLPHRVQSSAMDKIMENSLNEENCSEDFKNQENQENQQSNESNRKKTQNCAPIKKEKSSIPRQSFMTKMKKKRAPRRRWDSGANGNYSNEFASNSKYHHTSNFNSPYAYTQPRRALLSHPYSFPHPGQGQVFVPQIDFSRDMRGVE